MDDNYLNIDARILLAYQYYYEKNDNMCYNIKQVNVNDAKNPDNIKYQPTNEKMNNIINQLFNTDIKYIGKKGQKYIYERYGLYNVDVSISLYVDDLDDINQSNNGEIMHFLLSDFLTYKQTKHIIIPIINLDIPLSSIRNFLNKTQNDDIKKLLNNNDDKILKINITEHFFKKKTLHDALSDELLKSWSDLDFKILIFQLIHTLSLICTKYPNFAHNNLILKHINCYITTRNEKIFHEYEFNNKKFKWHNIGIDLRLDNFDDASLQDNNNNDIEMFFESLQKHNIFNKYANKNILEFISNCINIKEPIKIMNTIYFPDLYNLRDKQTTTLNKQKKSIKQNNISESDSDISKLSDSSSISSRSSESSNNSISDKHKKNKLNGRRKLYKIDTNDQYHEKATKNITSPIKQNIQENKKKTNRFSDFFGITNDNLNENKLYNPSSQQYQNDQNINQYINNLPGQQYQNDININQYMNNLPGTGQQNLYNSLPHQILDTSNQQNLHG